MKSEEDIKLKIVVPFLKDLGISPDEVSFESKFKIRLGTNVFDVKGNKKKTAYGSSDILCSRDDQNLFIIEVKDISHVLSPQDTDQAISYARLVHPIAPFAIVTNSVETRVYDTLTKQDLTGTRISESSTYWANGLTLSIEEELNQRFLALQNFVGYSEENSMAFSFAQVNARMSTLKGTGSNLNKKYIPELYYPVSYLENHFEQFLNSNSQMFSIIGETGVGKTSAMCYLTEKYFHKHIVFFLNGSELIKSILESIKEDCNWFFSPTLQEEDILTKLVFLTNRDRKLLIFIDAIDEILAPNINLVINELAGRIKKNPNIKICISCKSNEWHKILNVRGNPSNILDIIYKSPELQGNKSLEHESSIYSTEIHRFNPAEFEMVNILYRKVFAYSGDLNNTVKNELRLGFTLRTFATVFQNRQVPTNINDADLFEEYYKKTLDKLDFEKANNYLIEIAHIIYLNNDLIDSNSHSSGFINEQNLREKLRLRVEEKIYPELFSYNILTRITIGESSFIGFYYERFRNYIIAKKVLKLQSLNETGFKETLNRLLLNTVGQEVLLWYYHSSIFKHQTIIGDLYLEKAKIFVESYEEILNKHFKRIKNYFDPFTISRIGLLITDPHVVGMKSYALYPINSKNDQQLIVLNEPTHGNGFQLLESLMERYKCHTLRSGTDGFLIFDPVIKAKELIYEQLKKIINSGLLSEEKNEGILKEKVLSIIYHYHKYLDYNIETKGYYTINFNEDLHINLDEILNRIKYYNAQKYYRELSVQELVKNNMIPIKRHGNSISYSTSPKNFDNDAINQQAKFAVENSIPIPEPNISGDVPPFKALNRAIVELKSYTSEITNLLLPIPKLNKVDIEKNVLARGGSTGYIPDLITAQFSEIDAIKYLEIFFELFLQEYKIFIEHNFPGLESKFRLYGFLPVHIHCEIHFNKSCHVIYGFKKKSDPSKVTFELNPPKSIWMENSTARFSLVCGSTLANIIRNQKTTTIDKNIREKASELCAIRNFLYKWVSDELEQSNILI